jgi:uncharacterized protein
MRGRAEGARSSFQTLWILLAVPLAGMAVFLLWQWWNGGVTPREVVHSVHAAADSELTVPLPKVVPLEREGASSSTDREEKARQAAGDPVAASLPNTKLVSSAVRGRIVLIIDDLGFEGQPLESLMSLDPNLNLAILPNGTRASAFAETLHARGFEILCHLPMQPRGGEAPGRNAITTAMSDEEIARVTRENIEAVPHARGVNNHMGSLATSDRRVMASVMGALPKAMYFIDSRTGGRSVAEDVAREMNVPTAARHVFLDDVISESAVRRQLAELARVAEQKGMAIGIGHPHRATLRVLTAELPRLREQGFRFVRASEVVQ